MRDAYHEELAALTDRLVEMTRLVRSAMSRGTTALLDADLQLAESVISQDAEVDRLHQELEASIFELMATQQPVAVDLRTVITALRMAADLERMGDLAEHIAKLARMRHPESAIPAELRDTFVEMGAIAENLITKAGSCIASRDIDLAKELEDDDDAMDRRHRRLFRVLLSKDWEHGIEAAIDITLAGRYYERYATTPYASPATSCTSSRVRATRTPSPADATAHGGAEAPVLGGPGLPAFSHVAGFVARAE